MPKKQEGDLSLDQVMENNRLIRLKKLEEEGQTSFLTLLQFQGSLHISRLGFRLRKPIISTWVLLVQRWRLYHLSPWNATKKYNSSLRLNSQLWPSIVLLFHKLIASLSSFFFFLYCTFFLQCIELAQQKNVSSGLYYYYSHVLDQNSLFLIFNFQYQLDDGYGSSDQHCQATTSVFWPGCARLWSLTWFVSYFVVLRH